MWKEFYLSDQRAPYLQQNDESGYSGGRFEGVTVAALEQPLSSKNRVSSQSSLLLRSINVSSSSKKDEADTAGGGRVVSRVGSFLNIQRVHSEVTIRSTGLSSPEHFRRAEYSGRKKSTEDLLNITQSDSKENAYDNQDVESYNQIKPDWRLRDRMRTVGVGLVMALNPGTDPPDCQKPSPCAVLECWTDPRTISRSTAKGIIVEKLEQQYAKWQTARTGRPMKYKHALDPTVEEVRDLCSQLRRQARSERILLHYNGHGVPRPTANGECWVFDKKHREYIPLAVADLRQWLGTPSLVVLDCSAAGILLPFWTGPLSDSPPPSPARKPDGSIDMEEQSSRWVRETIVLCACSENEWVPMNPDYPADVFTSCLTTPIKIALRWFVRTNHSMASALDPEMVDTIPGVSNDRKTPLGELNWIFTAVTDSIAWNVLPKPLFQRLFRQDLLVASMFRNFLLADRIMRSLGCKPVSHPPLPPGIAQHPLWQAWDLACESMIFKLISEGVLDTSRVSSSDSPRSHDEETSPSNSPETKTPTQAPAVQPPPQPPQPVQQQPANSIASPFFSEQLTAFEVWLSFSEIHKMRLAKGELEPPEQLPVVLQVLLSPVLRVRALGLLRRFLDLGPWAVNLALSLGIFPYVMKMLQSPEYKSLLVSIWASILSFDSSCRVDLLKEGAFHHFVQHLTFGLNGPVMEVSEAASERTLAAYVLSLACYEYPAGQAECARLNLHGNCCALLSSYNHDEIAQDKTVDLHLPAHFRYWLCICIASMVKDNTLTQNEAYNSNVHTQLFKCSYDRDVNVRAAVCYALGCIIGSKPKQGSRPPSTQDLQGLASTPPGGMAAQRPPQFNPGPLVMPPPATGVSAPLQPQFSAPPGMPANLQWNPQQSMPGGPPVQFQQGQPLSLQPPFSQPGQSFPIPQQPYGMPGQPMPGQPIATPPGFLVGSTPLAGQPLLPPPGFNPPQSFPMESRPLKPSVFDDQQRISKDCQVMEHLASMASDASVVVRYEVTVALARAVGKYLDAFVVVADPPGQDVKFPVPRGLDHRTLERFRATWKVLRSLQHEDSFPAVSQAANEIVSVVHEVILKFKMESEAAPTSKPEDNMALHTKKLASILKGIDEDSHDESMGLDLSSSMEKDQSAESTPNRNEVNELRRVASEIATTHTSFEDAAKSLASGSQSPNSGVMPTNYKLPESSFYKWKKDSFKINFSFAEHQESDPLSPQGVLRAFHTRRNNLIKQKGAELARHFAPLIPKPPQPVRRSIELMLNDEAEEEEAEIAEEAARRRKELTFKERRVLRTDHEQTLMLDFHSYEDFLMTCCEGNNIAMWNTISGEKKVEFQNGNLKSSRMTTSTWVNEESSSLFLVGSDDGTVRLWGDLVENGGESQPTLVTSFLANRKTKGRLICEWQQFSGSLLAGGGGPTIDVWDLAAEKELLKLPTEVGTDTSVTTLTTAWDSDSLGMDPSPKGYSGIGPDIFAAGMSNGLIKLFDLRSNRPVNTMQPQKPRRTRFPTYTEHKTWVVSTSFTTYGGRSALVSGSTNGTVKVFDLRMSSSIRTIEAQRNPVMTALAVHQQIPIFATGSGAQFLKILTFDGETLQAIRNHESRSNYRIGPVSCLAFHRYKPILAAGATDSLIGLYRLPVNPL